MKLIDNPNFGMNSNFDKDLLPKQYEGLYQEEPFYPGDGNLSVDKLQKLCNQFKEYVHQQKVIKLRLLEEINNVTPLKSMSKCRHDWDEGSHNVYKCKICGKYNC